MKIKADKEGINAIKELLNIALTAGGINNLAQVNEILRSVEELKEEEDEHTD